MRHRAITLTTALLLFAGSLATIPLLGAEFIPRLDEGSIAMQIWRLPSISLQESNAISLVAEKVLMEEFEPEVKTVVSRTGRAEIATDPMGVEISDTYIILRPREQGGATLGRGGRGARGSSLTRRRASRGLGRARGSDLAGSPSKVQRPTGSYPGRPSSRAMISIGACSITKTSQPRDQSSPATAMSPGGAATRQRAPPSTRR